MILSVTSSQKHCSPGQRVVGSSASDYSLGASSFMSAVRLAIHECCVVRVPGV